MTDRTIYQLERAMDALTLAIKYLKEDMKPYKYSLENIPDINYVEYFNNTSSDKFKYDVKC